jgi:hypothetical protein
MRGPGLVIYELPTGLPAEAVSRLGQRARAQCRSRCSKGGWFGRIEDRLGGQGQQDEQGGKLHANADQMTCAMCVG